MHHSFVQLLSCVQLFHPWTVVCQGPLSMGFPRQEYCNGLSFPSSGDLPNPGIKIEKTMSQKIDPHRKEETWREQFYDSQKIS